MSGHSSAEEARTLPKNGSAPLAGGLAGLAPFERAVLLVFLVLGTVLRGCGSGDAPLFGDELHILPAVEQGFRALFSIQDPVEYMGYVGFGVLQRISFALLGPSAFSYRFPALLCGLLGLLLLYPVGRRLVGARPAWLATLVFAVLPMHVFFSRIARGYTFSVLLYLLLAAAVLAAHERPEKPWSWRTSVPVALLGGVLPFVHTIGVGFVLFLGFSAMFLSWRARRRWRDVLVAAGVFASAALLYVALLEPAREAIQRYMESRKDAKQETAGLVGVVTLVGGGFVAGSFMIVAGLAASVVLLFRRLATALIVLSAAIGPTLALVASQPPGMDYTYSRYLIGSVPFLLLAAAWGIDALLGKLAGGRAWIPRAAGLALVVVYLVSGPLFGPRMLGRPMMGSLLDLYAIPAFDVPYDKTPAFYRELGERDEDVTLIECPLSSGLPLVLRNYALQHGKRILTGEFNDSSEVYRRHPYVQVMDLDALAASGADYLVYHLTVLETKQYRRFVSEQLEVVGRWQDEHLADYLLGRSVYAEQTPAIQKGMNQRFGKPVFADNLIQVWSLRSPAAER